MVGLLCVGVGAGALFFGGAAALLATGPILGPILLAVSIGTLVIGAYKSMRKFFSDDYKMSEQRKAVDENLREICDNIEDKINETITNEIIDKNLKPFVEDLQDALQSSVENIKEASEFFETLRKNEILTLANQIKKEGGLK